MVPVNCFFENDRCHGDRDRPYEVASRRPYRPLVRSLSPGTRRLVQGDFEALDLHQPSGGGGRPGLGESARAETGDADGPGYFGAIWAAAHVRVMAWQEVATFAGRSEAIRSAYFRRPLHGKTRT